MSRNTRCLAILAVLAFVVTLDGCGAIGPLGPIAGGRLRGDIHEGPLPDWRFTSEIDTIQLETRPTDPHSVNTWCGVYENALYVPTSLILGAEEPTERGWVQHVLADPRVRLRIDGVVYELQARRVNDEKEREAARASLLEKYDTPADDHANKAWIFRMEQR